MTARSLMAARCLRECRCLRAPAFASFVDKMPAVHSRVMRGLAGASLMPEAALVTATSFLSKRHRSNLCVLSTGA
ncbi:hypothetical protein V1293_002210 [Bradyrhizobium sp. AZCC 1693]